MSRIHRSPRKTAIAAGMLFAMVGGAALAQGPGHGHGGPGHGPGYGPGHGGPGGAGFEHVIAEVQARLNLNSSQQALFDSALATTRSARQAARAEFARIREAMQAELSKAEPDLAAVAAVADDAQVKGQAVRRQIRDQWLGVYATFTPEQKQVVREALSARMERMNRFSERAAKHGHRG